MRTTILTTLLLTGAALAAPPTGTANGDGYPPDARFTVRDRGAAGLAVTVEIADCKLQIANCQSAIYNSQPRTLTRWVILPDRGAAEVRVTDLVASRLSHDGENISRTTLSMPEAGAMVRLGPPAIMRGVRMAPLMVRPVARQGRDWIAAERLEIEIEFTGEPGEHEVDFAPPPLSPVYQRLLEAVALNPDADWRPRRDLADEYRERMLILRPETLQDATALNWIAQFADWKRRQGLEVTVRAVDAVNLSSPQIRDIAADGYPHNPYDYLLIIGWSFTSEFLDETAQLQFPGFHMAGDSLEGDYYYGTFDGDDDLLPDIFVGRMISPTYASLCAALNRSMLYERDPYPGPEGHEWEWFRRALFVSDHVMARPDTTEDGRDTLIIEAPRDNKELGLWTKLALDQIGIATDTLYTSDDSAGRVDERRHLAPGATLTIAAGYLRGLIELENFADYAPTGRMHPFIVSNANYYRFKVLYPYFTVGTLQDPQGPIGGVGYFGWAYHDYTEDAIGGAVLSLTRGDAREGALWTGAALEVMGRLAVVDNEEARIEMRRYLWGLQLVGDPSLDIFTAPPATMSANLPQRLNSGATSVAFRVTDQGDNGVTGATVCIRQTNRFQFVATTDESGDVAFTVPNRLAEGTLLVTVSKHNFRPIARDVPVELPQVNLVLTDSDFDDSQVGDGDALLRNGETAELVVTFINDGEADAVNVEVGFWTDSPYLSFSRDTAPLDDIAYGESGGLAVPVRVMLSPNCPGGTLVRIQMNISSGQDRWQAAFEDTTSGPRYEVPADSVVYQDLTPGGHATVSPLLFNDGDFDGIELRAELLSQTPGVVVTHAAGRFPAVAQDSSVAPDSAFRVTVDSLFIPGQRARFDLRLAGEGNINFTLSFAKTISSPQAGDPIGPDGYGYLCFDSGDTLWPEAPRYQWREISPEAVGGADFVGSGVELPDRAAEEGSSAIVDLPFPFTYYGEEFRRLVICSNGWVSFDTNAVGFSSPDNRPVPGHAAPNAQVSICWQDIFNLTSWYDAVYTYYYRDAGLFIIEWSNVFLEQANGAPMDFQIVLLDPAVYRTPTGDGEIIFEYRRFAEVEGQVYGHRFAMVGIRDLSGEDGIQYAFAGRYDRAAHPIENEFAIKFTTAVRSPTGLMAGRVVRAEDEGVGLAGVRITHPQGFEAVSDSAGNFQASLRAGRYDNARATIEGFNDGVFSFVVNGGDTARLGLVRMTHPELAELPERVVTPLRPDGSRTVQPVTFRNAGNGPLDYTAHIVYSDSSGATFDTLRTFPLRRVLTETQNFGPAYVDTLFYIPRANVTADVAHPVITAMDIRGGRVAEFSQPMRDSSGLGISHLTWDGAHFWGSLIIDQARPWIVGFDREGRVFRSFRAPFARENMVAITFRPGHLSLFAASNGEDLVEISLDDDDLGTVIARWRIHFPSQVFNPTGLGWNPYDADGMPLYIIDTDLYGAVRTQRLTRFDPETGHYELWTYLPSRRTRPALGLALVPNLSRDHLLIAYTVDDFGNDTFKVVKIGPNVSFLSGPLQQRRGSVVAGAQGSVGLPFDARGMPEGDYSFGLELRHNGPGGYAFVPMTLHVDDEARAPDDAKVQPVVFGISGTYPNPFNARLAVDFLAPQGQPAVMRLYDLAGREVATLFDGVSAGKTRVYWKGDEASSGVYLVRLEAGGRVITRKVALVK